MTGDCAAGMMGCMTVRLHRPPLPAERRLDPLDPAVACSVAAAVIGSTVIVVAAAAVVAVG